MPSASSCLIVSRRASRSSRAPDWPRHPSLCGFARRDHRRRFVVSFGRCRPAPCRVAYTGEERRWSSVPYATQTLASLAPNVAMPILRTCCGDSSNGYASIAPRFAHRVRCWRWRSWSTARSRSADPSADPLYALVLVRGLSRPSPHRGRLRPRPTPPMTCSQLRRLPTVVNTTGVTRSRGESPSVHGATTKSPAPSV